MKVFKQRGNANEAKFAHESETDFQARAEALRQLAAWAASLKGGSPEETRDVARQLITADLRHAGDEQVVRAAKDYLGEGVDDATVREKLEELIQETRATLRFDRAS